MEIIKQTNKKTITTNHLSKSQMLVVSENNNLLKKIKIYSEKVCPEMSPFFCYFLTFGDFLILDLINLNRCFWFMQDV